MYTVVTAQGACHAPSARRALRGRCSVGRCVRGWSSPLTGASRTGLGWHWQDNAQLAAGPGPAERAHSPAACLSAARGRRCVGQGTPKQHARAPELRGGAMLVDSQATMMGGLSIWQVGPCRRRCPPCKGPSLAARPQRAGRGPHGHSHCGRGQASPGCVEHWPTGAQTHQTTRSTE